MDSIPAKSSQRGNVYIWMGLGGVVVAIAAYIAFLQFKPTYVALKPTRGPIVEAVYGLGTVTARRQFSHKLAVAETLTKAHVAEGEAVKSGQMLVQFSGGTSVKAPFAGIVTAFPFHEGENVFPQVSIVTIEDLTDRYIKVSLEQQSAMRVRVGQKARISFEMIRGEHFSGEVTHVYPSEGRFYIHVASDAIPPSILPGMTGDIAIEIGRRDNALLIPVLGISAGKVLVKRDGKRMKIDVKVGNIDSQFAEVVGGELQQDDEILVRNN